MCETTNGCLHDIEYCPAGPKIRLEAGTARRLNQAINNSQLRRRVVPASKQMLG